MTTCTYGHTCDGAASSGGCINVEVSCKYGAKLVLDVAAPCNALLIDRHDCVTAVDLSR